MNEMQTEQLRVGEDRLRNLGWKPRVASYQIRKTDGTPGGWVAQFHVWHEEGKDLKFLAYPAVEAYLSGVILSSTAGVVAGLLNSETRNAVFHEFSAPTGDDVRDCITVATSIVDAIEELRQEIDNESTITQ